MISVYQIYRLAQAAGQKLDDLRRDREAGILTPTEIGDHLAMLRGQIATIEDRADEISRKLRDLADS